MSDPLAKARIGIKRMQAAFAVQSPDEFWAGRDVAWSALDRAKEEQRALVDAVRAWRKWSEMEPISEYQDLMLATDKQYFIAQELTKAALDRLEEHRE